MLVEVDEPILHLRHTLQVRQERSQCLELAVVERIAADALEEGRESGAPAGGGLFGQTRRFTGDPTMGVGSRAGIGAARWASTPGCRSVPVAA